MKNAFQKNLDHPAVKSIAVASLAMRAKQLQNQAWSPTGLTPDEIAEKNKLHEQLMQEKKIEEASGTQ